MSCAVRAPTLSPRRLPRAPVLRRRRRVAVPPRAASSDTKDNNSQSSNDKKPPTVIVGGYFVADAKSSRRRDRLSAKGSRSASSSSTEEDASLSRHKALEATALADEALVMFCASAILGPLLDHQHSRFDILHYEEPLLIDVRELALKLLWGPGETPSPEVSAWIENVRGGTPDAAGAILREVFARETGVFETAWWVPLLFGGAGVVIGLGHTLGDTLRLRAGAKDEAVVNDAPPLAEFVEKCPGVPASTWEPAPLVVCAAVAAFALQYSCSGYLATTVDPAFPDMPRWGVDVVLATWGLSVWGTFDRTKQGFAMAVLTALAGPAAEIVLINVLGLYHYENPDWAGIPTWIPWVYFCGATAVGLLSRAVRADLRATLGLQTPTCEVAVASPKKAWRPPPRGNQRGKRSGATAVEQTARGKMTVIAVPVGGVDDEARGPDRVARGGRTEVNVEEGIQREGNDGGVDGDEDARNGNGTSVGETTASRESVASVKVRMMKRELQWMRSLRKEVNELQALKRRLESLRAAASAAAPPILPMLERRLEEAVPEKYRDTLEQVEAAFERDVLPKLPLSDDIRRRVGGRVEPSGAHAERLENLLALNDALLNVKDDLDGIAAKLEELEPRPGIPGEFEQSGFGGENITSVVANTQSRATSTRREKDDANE